MPGVAVIGVQWGDEGKGKIVDLLSAKADHVIRFQGGANAGHTLVVHGKKIVLHLVPSGILHPQTQCLIGPEVVLDPYAFKQEITGLQLGGIKCEGRVFVSSRTSLILNYHKALDKLREANSSNKIGTTGRGIGPAYEDLVGRRAITVGDLVLRTTKILGKLEEILKEKNILIRAHGGEPINPIFLAKDLQELSWFFQRFMMRDMTSFVNEALDRDERVLFEGGQGVLLDYVNGTYPFVTSSHTLPAAICAGLGVAPQKLSEIIGVAKAYTTRVGEGPFPTELSGREAERLRENGNEFGATTGRPRRCGTFDRPAVEYACKISGVTKIYLTKLDVLSGLPTVKVNDSYQLRGQIVKRFNIEDVDEYVATNDRPFQGWSTTNSGPAIDYVKGLEGMLGIPIAAASVGAEREDMKWFQ